MSVPTGVKCVMDIIITSGITMLVGSVSCRVLSIHIPISYLGRAGRRIFVAPQRGELYVYHATWWHGIASTVQATRELSFIHLRSKAEGLLKKMTAMGITTVEGKSGYGLNRETELLQLKVMRSLNKDEGVRVDIVPTFLGAHALPDEYKERPDDYIDFLIRELLPVIQRDSLAEFCDVFCEEGVFSIEQSRRLLTAAGDYGLLPKLHADEIVSLGGAELAAELGAVSADHLLHASDAGIEAMARKGSGCHTPPAHSVCLEGALCTGTRHD